MQRRVTPPPFPPIIETRDDPPEVPAFWRLWLRELIGQRSVADWVVLCILAVLFLGFAGLCVEAVVNAPPNADWTPPTPEERAATARFLAEQKEREEREAERLANRTPQEVAEDFFAANIKGGAKPISVVTKERSSSQETFLCNGRFLVTVEKGWLGIKATSIRDTW